MKFEIGKCYGWADGAFDPFMVLRRSEKTILVRNRTNQWRMRIRIDEDGNEYVVDSSMKRPDIFKSKATWTEPDMGYAHII